MMHATRSWREIAGAVAGLAFAASIGFALLLALPPNTGRTAQSVSFDAGAGGKTLQIRGSSDHDLVLLKMSADHGRFVIHGFIPGRKPRGCRWKRAHETLRCPADGVSAVTVDMGGSGDKLKVLDTLPVPLTVQLGSGSDKFIGAGEPDLCYTGGSNRNRCIGNGGNDVCIGGSLNEDCEGGSGNDYCKVLTGSDGCFGGPGKDVCVMGPGHDGCHGDGGNDRLLGGGSSDQLYGGAGSDYCDGGPGRGRSHTCERGPRK